MDISIDLATEAPRGRGATRDHHRVELYRLPSVDAAARMSVDVVVDLVVVVVVDLDGDGDVEVDTTFDAGQLQIPWDWGPSC